MRARFEIFLTFIGLKNAGLIAADPVTFVKLGTLGLPALLTVVATAKNFSRGLTRIRGDRK